jgi:hypothetical protein
MRIWIRDLVNPGCGIRDGKSRIPESCQPWMRDSGWEKSDPGSATLFLQIFLRNIKLISLFQLILGPPNPSPPPDPVPFLFLQSGSIIFSSGFQD